ncbi:hypothetical protein RIR_jg8884.t2 [Rhizophagus irregularis DAOM 181602=DAOM 197198]|nr:hypothetical protein RIR_jg8884.t2 [Rhizophagus irregularis DAOM 181602=DAOM 197198]
MQRNQLQIGYRNPEIGSKLDTGIPQEISSKLDIGILKSAPNWIPESRKEIGSKLYQNPAGNQLQIVPESRRKIISNL